MTMPQDTALRCVGCGVELKMVGSRHPRAALPCCGARDCLNVKKQRWHREGSPAARLRARDRAFVEACERYLSASPAERWDADMHLAAAITTAQAAYEAALGATS